MAKITLNTIGTLRTNTALDELNENFTTLATAIENTLSRDGTTPNSMGAQLDMNSEKIINLPAPTSSTEPMRHIDVQSLLLAAVSSTTQVTVAIDRTALVALSTSFLIAYLYEEGRAGSFKYTADASSSMVVSTIASSAVNSSTDTITSASHGMRTGHAFTPTSTVNGLTANTIYYAIRVDDDNFKAATSFANAMAGTQVDLTAASAIIVKHLKDPLQGVYVPLTTDVTGAGGAWERTDKRSPKISWWGASGDGTNQDHAVQAAIHYAEFEYSTGSSWNLDTGRALDLQGGEFVTTLGWTIRKNNVQLISTGGMAYLATNTASVEILEIGDDTYGSQIYGSVLDNITFAALSSQYNATTTVGIEAHDVLFARWTNIRWSNLYKGVDAYRLNSGEFVNWHFTQTQRTSNAAAFAIALKGRSTNGDTSGNNKFSNIEISGGGLSPAWLDAWLIMSVDGFYLSGGHAIDANYLMRFEPDGTHVGNVISDVLVDDYYLDAPHVNCVHFGGTTVATGGGITKEGLYQRITFGPNTFFRGAGGQANYLIFAEVDAANNGFRDIGIYGVLQQAGVTAMLFKGNGQTKIPVQGLDIDARFRDNAEDAATTVSAIDLDLKNGGSARIRGIFGPDQNASTQLIRVVADAGESVSIGPLHLSEANYTGAQPYTISNALGVHGEVISNDVGADRLFRDVWALSTSDATAQVIALRTLAANQAYAGRIRVQAQTAGGQQKSWQFIANASRISTASATMTGASPLTDFAHNTAGLASATAVVAVSGNDVRITLTGIAATDINWTVVADGLIS